MYVLSYIPDIHFWSDSPPVISVVIPPHLLWMIQHVIIVGSALFIPKRLISDGYLVKLFLCNIFIFLTSEHVWMPFLSQLPVGLADLFPVKFTLTRSLAHAIQNNFNKSSIVVKSSKNNCCQKFLLFVCLSFFYFVQKTCYSS